jgi:hypothetical protein
MTRRMVAAVAALLAAAPAGAVAQGFARACPLTAAVCIEAAQSAETTALRALLAHAGGAPVLGGASALGTRLGAPRLAAGLRAAATAAESADGSGYAVAGLSADVAVGVFSGFAAGPTTGGLGAIDLLGHAGLVHLPTGRGHARSVVPAFGAGVRIGVVSEGFDTPGVWTSATYRRLGTLRASADAAPSWELAGASALGLRAGAGKRVGAVGVAGGVGWDRVSARFTGPPLPGPGVRPGPDVDTGRAAIFAGAAWTRLVFSLAAEAGWQFGGDGPPAGFAGRDRTGSGAAWATIGARLTR